MKIQISAHQLLGIPLIFWAIVCLVVSIVWVFVWPSDRVDQLFGLRYLILRWGHALVWLLLAVAAFIAGLNLPGGVKTASTVALASLVVYIIFMATVLTSKQNP